MPRGATDMSHVWAGRSAAALQRKLSAAEALLRENGYTVTEPVDQRRVPATTQPAGR